MKMHDDTKLAKWLNNEMEKAELAEFTASPEFETYRKIRDYSAMLKAPEVNLDTLYNRIEENRGQDTVKVRPLRTRWIARIAAVLVMALGLTYFFYTNHTATQLADAGERTEFVLPDNSVVILNAGSQAEFKPNRWESQRAVELNGEAYFKVAKGKTFDVVTPIGTVTVVGTQFNVKARENRLDVTCFEGKVKVAYQSEVVYLLAGESIAFENGKSIVIPPSDIQNPGWLKYQASFTAEKPENVFREIERQYNVAIEVNATFNGKEFTGTIPTRDLNTTLDIIESVYQLKSERKGNTIILSSE